MGVFRLLVPYGTGSLESMALTVNQTPATIPERQWRGRFADFSRQFLQTFWPGNCLACGATGSSGRDMCGICAAALPWQHQACLRCALPLPDAIVVAAEGAATAPVCSTCVTEPPPLIEVRAACVYAAPLDRLAPRFKFHGDLAAGRVLSALMIDAFAGLPRPDAIVPVPLHRSRLRQRGYDQALELARPVARALRIPLLDAALVRSVATHPQSRLDAADRRYNLEDAFDVRAGLDLPAHLVLVDDVMTTGATLHSAAQTLYQAGAVRVDAWVAARVP